MRRVTFDLDALRSFVAGIELGSFAKAADRHGRSTSAISAQLKKPEAQAGYALLRRSGRGLALTDAGEVLLAYARRLLDLNDEAAGALHGPARQGWVRLGLQEDFGEHMLPDVLGRFARAHPKVRIEARFARHQEMLARVETGQLDLALVWDAGTATAHRKPPRPPGRCAGPRRPPVAHRLHQRQPGRRLGRGPRRPGPDLTHACLPASLALLPPAAGGLLTLPALGLNLHRADAEPAPAVARLAEILQQRLHEARVAYADPE